MRSKIFYFFSTIFLIFSCGKEEKNNENVSISILNEKLDYIRGDSVRLGTKTSTYNSLTQKIISTNYIEYEVKNNSEFTYVFLMNPLDYLIVDESLQFLSVDGSWGSLNLIIKDNKNNYVYVADSGSNGNTSMKIMLKESEIDIIEEEFRKNNPKSSYDIKIENAFLLKPDQSKIFSIKIKLPIINESNNISDGYGSTVAYMSDKIYKFKLSYYMSDEGVRNLLNKEEIKNLKTNRLKIFTGKLESNSVKILPIE